MGCLDDAKVAVTEAVVRLAGGREYRGPAWWEPARGLFVLHDNRRVAVVHEDGRWRTAD